MNFMLIKMKNFCMAKKNGGWGVSIIKDKVKKKVCNKKNCENLLNGQKWLLNVPLSISFQVICAFHYLWAILQLYKLQKTDVLFFSIEIQTFWPVEWNWLLPWGYWPIMCLLQIYFSIPKCPYCFLPLLLKEL